MKLRGHPSQLQMLVLYFSKNAVTFGMNALKSFSHGYVLISNNNQRHEDALGKMDKARPNWRTAHMEEGL
jgi:hypothetical protein